MSVRLSMLKVEEKVERTHLLVDQTCYKGFRRGFGGLDVPQSIYKLQNASIRLMVRP